MKDLLGGIWVPNDGIAHSKRVCDTLIDEACRMGVTVVEKCEVRQVSQTGGQVSSVSTNRGKIHCEYFVNCAGFWSRAIGEMSEPAVRIPIQAAEHYVLQTKPMEQLNGMMPVVRDLDGQFYMREIDGRLLIGGFEVNAKPAFQDNVMPCKLMEF